MFTMVGITFLLINSLFLLIAAKESKNGPFQDTGLKLKDVERAKLSPEFVSETKLRMERVLNDPVSFTALASIFCSYPQTSGTGHGTLTKIQQSSVLQVTSLMQACTRDIRWDSNEFDSFVSECWHSKQKPTAIMEQLADQKPLKDLREYKIESLDEAVERWLRSYVEQPDQVTFGELNNLFMQEIYRYEELDYFQDGMAEKARARQQRFLFLMTTTWSIIDRVMARTGKNIMINYELEQYLKVIQKVPQLLSDLTQSLIKVLLHAPRFKEICEKNDNETLTQIGKNFNRLKLIEIDIKKFPERLQELGCEAKPLKKAFTEVSQININVYREFFSQEESQGSLPEQFYDEIEKDKQYSARDVELNKLRFYFTVFQEFYGQHSYRFARHVDRKFVNPEKIAQIGRESQRAASKGLNKNLKMIGTMMLMAFVSVLVFLYHSFGWFIPRDVPMSGDYEITSLSGSEVSQESTQMWVVLTTVLTLLSVLFLAGVVYRKRRKIALFVDQKRTSIREKIQTGSRKSIRSGSKTSLSVK